MRIYLDHNAGAPLRPAVRQALAEFAAADTAGNPASVHFSGQRARRLLERSREQVAALIRAPSRSIVFTSGGTEANNFAILGAVEGFTGRRRRIVTSTVEHSSILEPLGALERRGFEVIRMPVDRDGRISPADTAAQVDANTALVTLCLANAEVGTIQKIEGIAEAACHAGALLHLDAAQAVGRMPLNAEATGCHLMTLSAHKIGGPSGIGALYVGPDCRLAPQMLGGPQEAGLRAGTPNLMGIVGFAAAANESMALMSEETLRVASLARTLLSSLAGAIPGLALNGPMAGRIDNTLNLTFPAVLGESMLIALDLEGVEVSMGSACAAGAVEPSHVLLAMGRDANEARSSLRVSLGWNTTREEVMRAAEIITRVWRRVATSEASAMEAPR